MSDHNHHSPPPRSGAGAPQDSSRPVPHLDESAGEAGEWDRIKQQAGELIDYLSYYIEAHADILKLRGRKFLFRLRLEIAGVLVIAGALVVAITLIVIGVSQGLAQVFPDKPWLGPLITGLVLLGIVSWAVWWWVVVTRKTAHNRMVEKYERRKIQQRARFGRDVVSRAEADRAEQGTGVSDSASR